MAHVEPNEEAVNERLMAVCMNLFGPVRYNTPMLKQQLAGDRDSDENPKDFSDDIHGDGCTQSMGGVLRRGVMAVVRRRLLKFEDVVGLWG